jgi:hypothetical protein
MARIRILVAVAAFAVVPLAAAARHVARETVIVRLTTGKITFAPADPHAGRVTFKLENRSKRAAKLRIADRTSAEVKPDKTGFLSVTLPKGKRPYELIVAGDRAADMSGMLAVA